MAYVSKRTGQEIDNLLDKVASGEGGGSAENGVDYAMSIDEPFEEYTIKVDADEEGKRIIKLNVASDLERAPSEFPIPNAEAVINYVNRMTSEVDVTRGEYSTENKKKIATNIGSFKTPDTLVKRDSNGAINATLIQDDQGLMLAYSSSGDEYKSEADEILLTESEADSRYAKKGEWKLVVDRRMEVGEQNVDFTTFADGTPLQAEEAVVQVIVDGVAVSATGYVAINSTTNKTDSLYGVIYYNASQVTGEGVTFVNHIEFKASPFVMIPKLMSGKVAVAVGGNYTGPVGSVASPQVYEDIVAIKLRPNAKITAAPPIIKIYAR